MITCVHECSRSRGLEWQIFLSYQRFKFYRSCQWHQKFISTAHAKLPSRQFLIETSFILLHVIWWFVWFCLHICLLIIKIMLLITWWPNPNFFEIHMANMVQLVVLVCSCIWNVFECSRIFLNNKSSKTCIDKDKNFDIQMIFAEFFFILLCFSYKFFCVDTNV